MSYNIPLDTFRLEELLPGLLEKKRRDEDLRLKRLLMDKEDGATSYTDPARDKAREYKLMRDAQRESDMEDKMQESRSYQSRMGELMRGRIGLPGGAALQMARNEDMMAQQGKMGGQRVVGGGRRGYGTPDTGTGEQGQDSRYLSFKSSENPFLSQQQDLMIQKMEEDIKSSQQKREQSLRDDQGIDNTIKQLKGGGTIGTDGWGTDAEGNQIYFGFGDAKIPPKEIVKKPVKTTYSQNKTDMISDLEGLIEQSNVSEEEKMRMSDALGNALGNNQDLYVLRNQLKKNIRMKGGDKKVTLSKDDNLEDFRKKQSEDRLLKTTSNNVSKFSKWK